MIPKCRQNGAQIELDGMVSFQFVKSPHRRGALRAHAHRAALIIHQRILASQLYIAVHPVSDPASPSVSLMARRCQPNEELQQRVRQNCLDNTEGFS